MWGDTRKNSFPSVLVEKLEDDDDDDDDNDNAKPL